MPSCTTTTFFAFLSSLAFVAAKPNCNSQNGNPNQDFEPIAVKVMPLDNDTEAIGIVTDMCRGHNAFFNGIGHLNFNHIFCNCVNDEYTETMDGVLTMDGYNSIKTEYLKLRAMMSSYHRECIYQDYDGATNTIFYQSITNVTSNMPVLNAFQFYLILNHSVVYADDGTAISGYSTTISTNLPMHNFGQIVSSAMQATNAMQGYLSGIPFFDVLLEWFSAHPQSVVVMGLCLFLVFMVGCCMAICNCFAKCCRRTGANGKYEKVLHFEEQAFMAGQSSSTSTSTSTNTN